MSITETFRKHFRAAFRKETAKAMRKNNPGKLSVEHDGGATYVLREDGSLYAVLPTEQWERLKTL